MERKRTYGLAIGTAACAFAIGYVMQYGLGLPGQGRGPDMPLAVTRITDTAAVAPAPATDPAPRADALPSMPADRAVPALPGTPAVAAPETAPAGHAARALLTQAAFDASTGQSGAPAPAIAATRPASRPDTADCTVEMTATPTAGALVRLELSAPCHPDERVSLHHSGLVVTEITDAEGALETTMPALAETALFIASFADDAGALARAEVTSQPFYDRVVLQWDGAAGLELHAREFGADYFADGHRWHEARGSLDAAAAGEGGFLLRLGAPGVAAPLFADVYSFPAGTSARGGEIAISVEAEITRANCGKEVAAQTMTVIGGGDPKVRDLELTMPECDGAGDFLVLKNLIEDLKIAAK